VPDSTKLAQLWQSRFHGQAPGFAAERDASTRIYEGANQIQRMVMARQLLKGQSSPADLPFMAARQATRQLPRRGPAEWIRPDGTRL
jgi:hypothetical protein